MSKESRLLKNTAILAIGNLCTKGVSFLMLPLYTAILSTEDYGVVDTLTVYSSLAVIVLTLQMEQGLFRFMVEARDCPERQKAYIQGTFAVAAGIVALYVLIGAFVLNRMDYAYTWYLLINSAVGVLHAIVLQIPRGFGDTVSYAVGSFLAGASTVILNVLFVAVMRWGVVGMLAAGMAGSAVSTVFVFAHLKLHTYLKIGKPDRDAVKDLLGFSLPLVPYTLCWWVIGASDRVIIQYTIGMAYNGVYAVAGKFSSLYKMVSNIFQTAWMESAYESVEEKGSNLYYQKMINSAVRFYSACNIGVIAVVPFVFDWLIHREFAQAYQYVPILLTAVMFHSVSSMYGSLYFAQKRTKQVLGTVLLAAAANVVINLALILKLGLYAAALSTLISYYAMMQIRYIEMKKRMGITIPKGYLGISAAVYSVIILGYYSKSVWCQIAGLAIAILYAVITNRNLLLAILRKKRM